MPAKLLATLLALALLAGCAHRPGLGSAADAATTAAVVESSHLAEANPLLGWIGDPVATALASVVLKHAAKHAITPLVGVDLAHCSVETAGLAAGGWNLVLLAGGATPPAVGAALATALAYWQTAARCSPTIHNPQR